MQNAENKKPEEVLLAMFKDMLAAAYTLLVFLATGFVIIGKFVFDALFEIVKAQREQDRSKTVKCPASNKG